MNIIIGTLIWIWGTFCVSIYVPLAMYDGGLKIYDDHEDEFDNWLKIDQPHYME